jgi:hypothetical protein
MAIAKEVYGLERIVPLRFSRLVDPKNPRAESGPPRGDAPDMDDRGFKVEFPGPIVGITEGRKIMVRLIRENIEDTAPLFVKSDTPSVVTIDSPQPGNLPDVKNMVIALKGVAGGNQTPQKAKIQVFYKDASGPLLAELMAWVFKPLRLNIIPHLVTIAQADGGAAAIGSKANVADIMKMVQDVWYQAGITFNVGTTLNENITLATAGVVNNAPFPGDIDKILKLHWTGTGINVYFVHRIGNGGTLGYGFSPKVYSRFGLTNPGILVADTTAWGSVRDVQWWANDLAHEIGHFLNLWHPDKCEIPDLLQDSWSRRMLMHNNNHMIGHNPWPLEYQAARPAVPATPTTPAQPATPAVYYKYRPRFDDVGYGNLNRGFMITMKDYARHKTDGEALTARNAARSLIPKKPKLPRFLDPRKMGH